MAPGLKLRTVDSIARVEADAWDRCAGGANPFVSHAFLHALEASGSANRASGWGPMHLVASVGARVVAVVPLYQKAHSWGEYVFDHPWADAWKRAGGRYYPKLLGAVPFTPVPGPRLLVAPDAPADTRSVLIGALEAATRSGLSSAHVTFLDPTDRAAFAAAGWLERLGFQFHWTNQGYGSFEDFLATFTSKRRKETRRERRIVGEAGLRLVDLPGSEVTPALWDAFHGLYQRNVDTKWGAAYLTPAFFRTLGATLPDRVILSAAFDGERLVAGALHLVGSDALYGRNWGTSVEVPFLHFELCYYRAIDLAIARGLARVEAGAQGEHKLQRGYMPTATASAHFLPDPRFRAAVAEFVQREREHVEQVIGAYAEASPFHEG
jgi:predicted N-acyltransferase